MTTIVRRPGPRLTGLVEAIVYQGGEQTETVREWIVPEATTGIWINLNRDEFCHQDARGVQQVGGAVVAGARDRVSAIDIEAGRSHICVSFVPGAARPAFAVPLSVIRNATVDLDEVCGADARSLRERLLEAATPDDALRAMEQALLRQVADTSGPDPAMVFAAGALAAGTSLAEVQRRTGLLPRTFRRRFLDQVGITPKRFARVRRLQRTIHSLDLIPGTDTDWAGTAVRNGYGDQSHLIDDFREMIDLTPTQYLRRRIDGPTHLRSS